jgi:hypothetical protein
MQPAELQIGHIVHLNSGSPDLKIVAINGNEIEIEWTNEKGQSERTTLPRVCFVVK